MTAYGPADIRLRNMTSLYLYDETGVFCLFRIGSRIADKKYIGSAGGHFEQEELSDPKCCVLREAREELGIEEEELEDLRLRYITYRLKDGEIRQNYYYFARLRERKELISTEGRLEHIAFADIPALHMPVSAKHMILHYLETGRYTQALYAGVTQEEGTPFLMMREFSLEEAECRTVR